MEQLRAALLFALSYGLCLSPLCRVAALLESPTSQALPERASAVARDTYRTRCSACHGATGHGDGPATSDLTFDPPDCRDGNWQRTHSDADLKRAVLYGGAAVGRSAVMPAHMDLLQQPAVLDALILLLRDCSLLAEPMQ